MRGGERSHRENNKKMVWGGGGGIVAPKRVKKNRKDEVCDWRAWQLKNWRPFPFLLNFAFISLFFLFCLRKTEPIEKTLDLTRKKNRFLRVRVYTDFICVRTCICIRVSRVFLNELFISFLFPNSLAAMFYINSSIFRSLV